MSGKKTELTITVELPPAGAVHLRRLWFQQMRAAGATLNPLPGDCAALTLGPGDCDSGDCDDPDDDPDDTDVLPTHTVGEG